MASLVGGGFAISDYDKSLQDQSVLRQNAARTAFLQQQTAQQAQLFAQQQAQQQAMQHAQDASLMQQFGGGPAPQPGQQSQPSQGAIPGQSAMPQGGAQPSPVAPQSQLSPVSLPGAGPMPGAQSQPQQPQAQARPPQQPQQGQGQPGQGQQGQGQPGQDPFAALQRIQKIMATPLAQRIAQDPGVVKATDQMHGVVADLKKDGVGVNGVGLTLEQHSRLQIAMQNLNNASAQAAKNTGESDKNSILLGNDFAKVLMTQMKEQEMVARAGGRGAGGRGSNAPIPSYDSLSTNEKGIVDSFVKAYKATGRFPYGTGYGGRASQLKEVALAQMSEEDKGGASYAQGAVTTKAENDSDAKSLANVQKQADQMERSFNTLHDNMAYLIDTAKKYGLQPNQPFNTVANAVRQATGDAGAAKLAGALSSVQREYGRVSEGSTGAGATTATSLKNAEGVIKSNFTLAQLEGAQAVMLNDGGNVVKYYKQQAKDIMSRLSARGGGGAPQAGAGKTVTTKAIQDAAASSGQSVEKMMAQVKAAGFSVQQ